MSTETVGFGQFSLSEDTKKMIAKLGFENPTPVQAAVIPLLLGDKTDIIALANTGTGKTGAFGIPLVERLENEKKTQALVLCPTRELAMQVAQNLQSFGSAKGLRVATIVGGESYRKQFDMLRANPNIVVSTPGRLIDLMEQNKINLKDVEYLILDEADEMLSFGFKEALESIWSALEEGGKEHNTWLFSATMNPSIQRLTHKYLNSPKEIFLQKVQDASRVESYAAVVYEEDKPDALCLALLQTKDFYGIVFCQTKQQVDNLEHKIRECGFKVQSLHGDKTQQERTTTIKRLKNREFHILVATDVAARGLDIEDLTHVVNFDLPWDHETYTHRIGRTARAGKTGTVWNFTKPKDIRQMKNLEKSLKVTFKNLDIASADQIRGNLIENWMNTLNSFQPTTHSTNDVKAAIEKVFPDAPLSAETELWLARVLQYFHVGLPKNIRAPRVMDFTRLQDRNPNHDGGSRREFGGDRRSRFGGRGGDRGGRPSRYGGGGFSGGRSRRDDRAGDRGGEGRSFDRANDRTSEGRSERSEFRSEAPRSERPERTERSFDHSEGRVEGRSARSERSERSFERRDRGSLNSRFSEDRKPSSRFDYDSAPSPAARKERGRRPERSAASREW